jgi:hypothetical protein
MFLRNVAWLGLVSKLVYFFTPIWRQLMTPPSSSPLVHAQFLLGCGLVYRWDGLDPVSDHILVVGTEIFPDTLANFNQLIWLISREHSVSPRCSVIVLCMLHEAMEYGHAGH